MALYCSRNYHSGSFEYFRKCLHVRQHTISQVCRYDVDMKMREFEDGCGVSLAQLVGSGLLIYASIPYDIIHSLSVFQGKG